MATQVTKSENPLLQPLITGHTDENPTFVEEAKKTHEIMKSLTGIQVQLAKIENDIRNLHVIVQPSNDFENIIAHGDGGETVNSDVMETDIQEAQIVNSEEGDILDYEVNRRKCCIYKLIFVIFGLGGILGVIIGAVALRDN